MTEESPLQGAVFVIEVADRPGVVHSIAAVFAHRGLSIESFVAETGRERPRVLVVFRGTARHCRIVEQVLARLHHVLSVRTLPTDSAELRALAFCHIKGNLPAFPAVTQQSLAPDRALLIGSYAAVENAVAELRREGSVSEVSRSLVAS